LQVLQDGVTVQTLSDPNAAFEDRSFEVQSTPIIGQLVYANPRNACKPVAPIDENATGNVFALIDEYLTCPDVDANLYMRRYSMMIALSSVPGAKLDPGTYMPQALILNSYFGDYLRQHAVVGVSPNASTVRLRVYDDAYARLEKLFIVFGAILLAAVVLSVAVFCFSLCCRVCLQKWRTRGLSRWRVHQLPKRKYRRDREECETCSICLEDFKEGETIRVLPCDHVFHPLCVDEWLQKWNRCCPLCKSAIKRRTHHTSGQEESHLLSDEDLQNEREEETYGATGHSDPIAEASSESLGTAHSDSDHEARSPLSISTVATVEISSEVPPTVESGREDREDPAPTNIPEGSTSIVRV